MELETRDPSAHEVATPALAFTLEPLPDGIFEPVRMAPPRAAPLAPTAAPKPVVQLIAGPALNPALDEKLDPARILHHTPDNLDAMLAQVAEDYVSTRYASDRWLHNYLLNRWECVHGRAVLKSWPWNLTLGVTTTCNAKCGFCSVPLRRSRNPALASDLGKIPHLESILSYARVLILTGGEPTIHPRFAQMLRRMGEIMDSRAYTTMITHGDRLHKFKSELEGVNVNFTVSLNAATVRTHQSLMRLGEESLPRILASLRWARSINRHVSLSLVVVQENLAEIPQFIKIAEDLGASAIYLRTLIPGDYYTAMFPNPADFAGLPPWNHPDFERLQEAAQKAIAYTSVPVNGDPTQWGLRLQSAELPPNTQRDKLMEVVRNDPAITHSKGDMLPDGSAFDNWRRPVPNPYGRTAPFECTYPWHATKILDTSESLHPCSFLHHVVGYDAIGLHGSKDFFELWNSRAMIHLRKTLQEGPLLPECITCPYQMGGSGQIQSDHRKKPN